MKVIIADDSAVIRTILTQNLAKHGIEVLAAVSNGRKAIDWARESPPDVVISDIDMPEMDGLAATRILAGELHVPVLVLSEDAAASVDAKHAGAMEFVKKPRVQDYNEPFFTALLEKVRRMARLSARHAGHLDTDAAGSGPAQEFASFKVLCLGASTGGPSAVAEVLGGLGAGFPLPILYVQHIEVGADRKMAEWFDATCPALHVRLAEDGEAARPGTVYMAPADTHLVVDYVRNDGSPVLKLSHEPPERFLRPAVNLLFRSAARRYGRACLAVLLTGMGRDGAEGCKAIRDAGGYTIAEDQSTCTVFGMPAAAIELGGACEVLPRNEVAARLTALARKSGTGGTL